MVLPSMSVLAVLLLGGAVAAGLSALIVIAVASLILIGFANAVRTLGQLLDVLGG